MILPGISLLDADYVVIFIRLIKNEIEKGCLMNFYFLQNELLQ